MVAWAAATSSPRNLATMARRVVCTIGNGSKRGQSKRDTRRGISIVSVQSEPTRAAALHQVVVQAAEGRARRPPCRAPRRTLPSERANRPERGVGERDLHAEEAADEGGRRGGELV